MVDLELEVLTIRKTYVCTAKGITRIHSIEDIPTRISFVNVVT